MLTCMGVQAEHAVLQARFGGLEEEARGLQGRVGELEGEGRGLIAENRHLKAALEERQAALTQQHNLSRELQFTVDDQRADIRAALDLVSAHLCLHHHDLWPDQPVLHGNSTCSVPQPAQSSVGCDSAPSSHSQLPQGSGRPRHHTTCQQKCWVIKKSTCTHLTVHAPITVGFGCKWCFNHAISGLSFMKEASQPL